MTELRCLQQQESEKLQLNKPEAPVPEQGNVKKDRGHHR